MLNISYSYVKVEENITKEKALHKECLEKLFYLLVLNVTSL